MIEDKEFVLRQEHIDLLEESYVTWDDAMEGAPEINPKRPLGNSGSTFRQDVCRTLGYEPIEGEYPNATFSEEDWQDARDVYDELDTALQIVLTCQTFEPGVFETSPYGKDWERVD